MSLTTPFNVNSFRTVFVGKQIPVLYNNGEMPKYPLQNIVLAPSTDPANPTYSAGRLLAIYGSDAPNSKLIGAAVNFDPNSTVASQKICVGVLADPFAYNLTGLDLTNPTTATNTVCRTEMAQFLIGVTYYQYPIDFYNTSAVVTAFKAQYKISTIDTAFYGTVRTSVNTIQGVV